MQEGENHNVPHRPPRFLLYLGCLLAFTIVIMAGVIAYSTFAPRELHAPLVLALPDCKAGVYTKPAGKSVDIFDDVGNDAAKRACDSTKGFQGEAVLSRGHLKLKIHNSDNTPLSIIQVRLIVKPPYATTFAREYRLEGKIPPLSDGELQTSSNLDPRGLESFSALVTWVYFEG